MKRRNIILGIIFFGTLFILAYIFSQQVKPISTVKLPYYTYNKDSNALKQSTFPDIKISSFSFKDQRSDPFTEKNIAGKIYVADYFFVTCPGICKEMGTQMQRIYKKFENNENVILLSHTSKPEEDTPEVLMAYAKKLGVSNHDKWVFLTGEKKHLYEVARNQYHIVDDTGNGDEEDFIHTERFVLVDKAGFIRGYYDGTDSTDVNKLLKDITILSEH